MRAFIGSTNNEYLPWVIITIPSSDAERWYDLFARTHAEESDTVAVVLWRDSYWLESITEKGDDLLIVGDMREIDVDEDDLGHLASPYGNPGNTQTQRIHVTSRGVYASAYPKHGDSPAESHLITWKALGLEGG